MLLLDGHSLTIEAVAHAARQGEPVLLSPEAAAAIDQARAWVETILRSDRPVYGINTGFGVFADRRIPAQDSATLSRNLILSHAVGTGDPMPADLVRAAMLVRANTLAKGYSGIRRVVIETMLEMVNRSVTPEIPCQGSLGSSGDLGPLSHMALVLTTGAADCEAESGWAVYQGQRLTGKAAMAAAGLERVRLEAKEGLALNNGATFSAAAGALAIVDTARLLNCAEMAAAMSLEAMMGCSDAYDERLHAARGHTGQRLAARHIRQLTAGSELLNGAARVQDAYSLRCAPQVQGPARDLLAFVQQAIEREINAATDNPLLFGDGEAISGGNFHGELIGQAMDFLKIAVAEVAAISERRTYRLTDGKLNGDLPPMLVDTPEAAGLNSGLMMPQYTAAALVLENQTLAHPDSVHSLPTSAAQEDHNANAMTAARHARQVVDNALRVVAIELFTAARAIDLRLRQRKGARLGAGTARVYERIRAEVPYRAGDAWWGPEIDQVVELVRKGALCDLIDWDDSGSLSA